MHVAGMEDSAASPAHQGNSLTAQPGAGLSPGQELCQTILRSEEAETEAEGDHVAVSVIVRVARVAEQIDLGQILALHCVQLTVQLVEVRRLVESVERPGATGSTN